MFCFVSVPSASKFKKLFSRENFLKIQIMDLNFECRAVCDFPIPTHDRWSLVFSIAIHHTSFREFFFWRKRKNMLVFGASLKKFGAPTNFWLAFNGFPDTSFSANLKLPLSDYTYWLCNDNKSRKIFSKNRLVITNRPGSSIHVGIIVE